MTLPASGFRAPSIEFIACHRLAAAELPPHRLRALLTFAGSPTEALQIQSSDLMGPKIGLTEKQIARLGAALQVNLSPKFIEKAESLGVQVICFDRQADYPANLVSLKDAPPLLFVRGALHADDKFSIAIVGSRRATSYGHKQAERFARTFAERGLAVISGGAAGIDTAAHRGALWSGGRTVAVLGCGVDVTYPSENRALFAEIVERGGAIVSEFALETRPEPWRFPTRNRIIAGIAQATVLVETPKDSGALITAQNAAEYGRDVWVVPGPVDTGRSRGGHQLVQDGAALADAPEDVLTGLGIPVEPPPAPRQKTEVVPVRAAAPTPTAATASAASAAETAAPAPAAPPPPVPTGLSEPEIQLLRHLDLTPRHLDEASAAAALIAPQATVAATLLEMKGLVRRLPGNLYVRAL